MKTMNLSRCSNAVTLLLVITLVATMVVPAAAVSTSADSVPNEAEVGESLTVEFELTDLYEESNAWTLNASTDLDGADWEFRAYDNTGDQVGSTDEQTGNETTFRVSAEDGVNSVEVRLSGSVPEIENYSYDPEERFTLAEFVQTTEGGSVNDIDEWTTHHYTEESADARATIEAAEAAIAAAADEGADTSEAETTLSNAVSAYEGQNFDLAVTHGNDAADQADDSAASAAQRQLLTYGAIALVLLLLIGGGGYVLYQRNQTDADPLG